MRRYNGRLKHRARQLRKNMTDSERALWFRLRGKQLHGVQFYRQKPIGAYIVDFFAPKANLVVELDGSQHKENTQAQKDVHRDAYLMDAGLCVLRFNSSDVLRNTDGVVEVISCTVRDRLNV